ncbi:SpaA isopeptide-forming pilin-related protein [Homoserinibacter sp. GY 40078]|uniref:DUF6923 family protein n=1 Tax=Homoserinibacter sp. GY 40078 TaxID=2603275 RepID=UPI0011CB1618|nr:SpaA isopeptide-forming pilin-related protein [Homoserinibacter sp. GY 40078]TXK19163.1 DUF11 domain-containing protein [Homoserinibacter sp. GY 40078]
MTNSGRRQNPPHPRHRSRHRFTRKDIPLGLGLAALVVITGALTQLPQAADAASPTAFDPSTPRVFVAQDTPTRLYSAVQGAGTVTFVPSGGSTAGVSYNAIAYHQSDNYIYAIRRDKDHRREVLKIGLDNTTQNLGAAAGLAAPGPNAGAIYNQGAFGEGEFSDTLFIRSSYADYLTEMYAIDITQTPPVATKITLRSEVPNVSDIVFRDGYLWGFETGSTIWRIDPTPTIDPDDPTAAPTAAIASFETGLGPRAGAPAGTFIAESTFGAQWVYGNGNLGISANTTGKVYQIAISDASSGTPTFRLVSISNGPASDNNDGTAIIGDPLDLAIVKTGPATYTPGDQITYTLTITNNGPSGSSGSVVTDDIPDAILSPSIPSGTDAPPANAGCEILDVDGGGHQLRCVVGELASAPAANSSTTITFTGTVAAGTTGILTNAATVTGFEVDTDPTNNTDEWSSTPPGALRCDVVHGITAAGALHAIDPATGSTITSGSIAASGLDGLGISSDGTTAYAVSSTAGTHHVYRYDVLTATTTDSGPLDGAESLELVAGAVNPADGAYYVAGFTDETLVVFEFDPTAGALVPRFAVDNPVSTPPIGVLGPQADLAFDTTGRAYLLISSGTERVSDGSGNQIVAVDAPPTDGSIAPYRVLIFPEPAAEVFAGVAFGTESTLYGSGSTSTPELTQIDPNSGSALDAHEIRDSSGAAVAIDDLASCAYPSTITLQKDVVSRFREADQFVLKITGNGLLGGNMGATAGAGLGLQTSTAATAGAVIAVPGRSYTITETEQDGTDFTYYDSSWECGEPSGGTALADGAGTTGAISLASAPVAGRHVRCVFANVASADWHLSKRALLDGTTTPLERGATVHPGDTLRYEVTIENSTSPDVEDVTIEDDLGDVLDDATFVTGSAQLEIDGSTTAVSDPVGGMLTTEPFTLPAGATATLSYLVRVDDDAFAATLRNVVTGNSPQVPPAPCSDECETLQVTPDSVPLQVLKVGEDTTAQVVPMAGSEWAVYDAAVGGTALLDPLPAAEDSDGPITGLFASMALPPGTYWLEETHALPGFQLLAERVPFTLDAGGTHLADDAPANISVIDVDGTPTIRVEDVPVYDIPDAGGPGTAPFLLAGGALLVVGAIGAAVIALRRTSPTGRRVARTSRLR